MNTWFSKNLGDGILAWEPLDQIEAFFQSEYAKVGTPKEMAVFTRHESEGRLHCEVTVYFSPASIVVANAFDASPCTSPSPDGLNLLGGSKDSWGVLFSKQL
ncbi:MAG: hypothetical protein DHS20C18_25400 [Saprospiraceae bacterium]|nr:MAG: hypothetical protein DHS20C18_25400 [Saprospiraceae bacterium]